MPLYRNRFEERETVCRMGNVVKDTYWTPTGRQEHGADKEFVKVILSWPQVVAVADGGGEVKFHTFLTSALCRGEWSLNTKHMEFINE
jgi:hypothetical protein